MSWLIDAARQERRQSAPLGDDLHIAPVDTGNVALLDGLYERTKAEGLIRDLFFDDGIANAADFEQLMLESLLVLAVYDGPDWIGYTWVNMPMGRAVAAHCCLFPNGWGRKGQEAGKRVMRYLLTIHANGGDSYWIDTVYGMTPATHRHAVLYARRIGMRAAGVLPNGCMVHGAPTDLVMSAITRLDLAQDEVM